MFFSEIEQKKLRDATELYRKTKFLIIKAEELDNDDKTKLGAFDELRHAFDHLMRVFFLKLNLREDVVDPDQYYLENLGKLFGHVFRAGYDALDWLNISFFKKIKNVLRKYHREDIRDVIPNFYSEIQPRLYEIKDKIVKYRNEKDVRVLDINVFDSYIEEIRELEGFYKDVISKEEQLISIRKKRIKETIFDKKFLIATIISITAIIIGIFM